MGRVEVWANLPAGLDPVTSAAVAQDALRAGGLDDATVSARPRGRSYLYTVETALELEPSTEAWARGVVVETLTADHSNPDRRIAALEHTLADLLARLAPILATLPPAPPVVDPIPSEPEDRPPFPRPNPPTTGPPAGHPGT